MKRSFSFIVWIAVNLLVSPLVAQEAYNVSGRVIDSKDGGPLAGIAVSLHSTVDTSLKYGTVTDIAGVFSLTGLPAGSYSARMNYVGYKLLRRRLSVNRNTDMGTLKMEQVAKALKEVTVAGKQVRGEQKGDTSQFNADAYKTNPDATAEDLVSKMPGVTSDGSGVKVNGESVQQVLVDGKPFFGTDPTLALKNMPAEVIDKIQVFDKLTDQSAFTGFDDGNAQKTMNIITRRGKSEGVFGKVYGGYGTSERYAAGGNMNFFNGDRRITLLGMANNINQQNFSSEDVLGIGNQGGRGPNRRGGGGVNNFMVGQQSGIAATQSFGVNYSDTWGKKVKVSGSYFYNWSQTDNNSDLNRQYFGSSDSQTVYAEKNTQHTDNGNHRFSGRLEYNIDSSNSMIFTPSASFQNNSSTTGTDAETRGAGVLQSLTATKNTTNNNGYNASGNLLYQHKFAKERRTVSLNVGTTVNEKTGDGTIFSANQYYDVDTLSTGRDQRYDQYSNATSIDADVRYTEPVGHSGQLMLSYNPSRTQSIADKAVHDKDAATNEYLTNVDTLYSNRYTNNYTVQKGGVSYRIGDRGDKAHYNIGLNVQQASLDGTLTFPASATITRTFTNVLPNAFLNYKYGDGRNLRVMYRTSTDAPNVSQLQNVVNVSNPLLLSTGNAGLKQAFEQRLIVRYGLTKSQSGRNFFLSLYANATKDYIASATYIPRSDSLFSDSLSGNAVTIRRGGQLTMPVNLDGYRNVRTFATYGFPVAVIKSNLNFNGGLSYTRTPGLINDRLNYATNLVPFVGLVLSSNVSEKLDFTFSYTGNYNIVSNTLQSQANNNFFNHTASFRLNWIFRNNFVLNTNITNNYYTAFSGTGAQNYYLWGGYIGYKFMKKSMEARISVYDLLNQNTSITRNVTEVYIENTNTQVLKQYFLAQLTWTVRKFKSGAPPEQDKEDVMPRPPFGRDYRPH